MTGGWQVQRLTLQGNTIRGLNVVAAHEGSGGCAICSWDTNDTGWVIDGNTITGVRVTGQYEKLIHGMYLHGRRFIVRNNRVDMGGNGGFALHLYTTPDDILVEHNWLANSHGGIFNGGARGRILNNTLVGHGHFTLWGVAPPGAIVLRQTAHGNVVQGNTIQNHHGPCVRAKGVAVLAHDNTCNQGPALVSGGEIVDPGEGTLDPQQPGPGRPFPPSRVGTILVPQRCPGIVPGLPVTGLSPPLPAGESPRVPPPGGGPPPMTDLLPDPGGALAPGLVAGAGGLAAGGAAPGVRLPANLPCTAHAAPGDLAALLGQARAGTVLCLAPGNYGTLHLPASFAGTAEQPIVLRAEREGSVWFSGNNPVWLRGRYGVFEGVDIRDATGDFGLALGGDHWTVRRVTVHSRSAGAAIDVAATNSLLEDFVAFGYGRKLVTATASTDATLNTTLRRGWIAWTAFQGGSPKHALELGYRAKGVTAENMLLTWLPHPDPPRIVGEGIVNINGEQGNRLLGSIIYCAAGASCRSGGKLVNVHNREEPSEKLRQTHLEDLVAVMAPGHPEFGQRAFALHECGNGACGGDNTARNLVGIAGGTSTCDWQGGGCGAIREAPSVPAVLAKLPGQPQSLWTAVPGICHRLLNGQRTGQPLWPWPMQGRLSATLQQAGRSPVDVQRTMEGLLGPLPAQCRG
jgi:hypothetical protein